MKPYGRDPNAPAHVRALLDSARGDDLDANRRRRVAMQLGLVPSAGPVVPTNDGASTRRIPGGAAGGAALAALAMIGASLVFVGPLRSPSVPTPPVVVAPVAAAAPAPLATQQPASTNVEPPPAPQAAAVAQVASVDVAALPDARKKPVAAARSEHAAQHEPDPGDLRLEIIALDGVRQASASGRPRAALALLDEYASKFPNGKLREEALVLRIEALHASGDQAAAEKLAHRLLADSPNTPYAARVRAALVTASPEER
jgi:hypothetical protein